MSSTVNRKSVDIAPSPPRATLAFVLALLSVPGSTMAWELPSGGFWIGLPLAIAAIVLGVKARRRAEGGSRLAVAAIVIAALMIAMMVVWTIASLAG